MEEWNDRSAEEEDIKEQSGTLMSSLKQKDALESEKLKQVLPTLERRPSLGHETSALSVQSDPTLEFHDAFSSDDVIKTVWQSHDRLDEDEEVIVNARESDTATGTLSAEEPIENQETEREEKVPEIETQPDAEEEHSNEDPERQEKESSGKIETQNFPVVPGTSLEESSQEESVKHEMGVLVPREPIRTSGISEDLIRGEDTKDFESTQPPIINDAVTAEEPIRESLEESRESVEPSVVNKEPIRELAAVSEELKDKPEALDTSGED